MGLSSELLVCCAPKLRAEFPFVILWASFNIALNTYFNMRWWPLQVPGTGAFLWCWVTLSVIYHIILLSLSLPLFFSPVHFYCITVASHICSRTLSGHIKSIVMLCLPWVTSCKSRDSLLTEQHNPSRLFFRQLILPLCYLFSIVWRFCGFC